jgi:hypothetical protein
MVPPSPGFDTSRVSPRDAVATLRSLRRRYAEAFDQADDAGELGRRPADGGLSPRQHAAWTAIALDAIGSALQRVMVTSNPSIELPPVDPAGPVPDGADNPSAVLSGLGDTARWVADAMADMHGEDWARTGHAATGDVSALDIARLAVQIAVEHLRAAEAAIGAPPAS